MRTLTLCFMLAVCQLVLAQPFFIDNEPDNAIVQNEDGTYSEFVDGKLIPILQPKGVLFTWKEITTLVNKREVITRTDSTIMSTLFDWNNGYPRLRGRERDYRSEYVFQRVSGQGEIPRPICCFYFESTRFNPVLLAICIAMFGYTLAFLLMVRHRSRFSFLMTGIAFLVGVLVSYFLGGWQSLVLAVILSGIVVLWDIPNKVLNWGESEFLYAVERFAFGAAGAFLFSLCLLDTWDEPASKNSFFWTVVGLIVVAWGGVAMVWNTYTGVSSKAQTA